MGAAVFPGPLVRTCWSVFRATTSGAFPPLPVNPRTNPLSPVRCRTLVGRHKGPKKSRNSGPVLRAGLDLDDAAFGPGAEGQGEVSFANTTYRLSARLEPLETIARTPHLQQLDYSGKLSLRIADAHGHEWHARYDVSGPLEVQGRVVVAPFGLTITDPVSSSAKPRHGELPARPPYRSIDFSVAMQVAFDPRHKSSALPAGDD